MFITQAHLSMVVAAWSGGWRLVRWSVDAAERGGGHGRACMWDGEQWGLCHVAVLLGFSGGHMAVREERQKDHTSES